ncbi:MAG: circularly permuted type 2 ATP-grasp protein [Betaproteobacteria bacterium]
MSRPCYDEMLAPEAAVRPHYQVFAGWLARTPTARIAQKREQAERAFHRVGITFAVYVRNDTVFMRTTRGPQRVDVICRRVDDDHLDLRWQPAA